MPVLDEFALDFLEPEEQRLVKEMLQAVVDHPDIYSNGFSVSRRTDGLYEYHLGSNQRPGPFRNPQTLPTDIRGTLIYHKIAGRKIDRQWPDDFLSFTDDALAWCREYGGPSPDEVRKKLGRWLRKQIGGSYKEFVVDAVSNEIGISPDRVHGEIHLLMAAGLVERHLRSDMEFGVLRLTESRGILWAAADFPPIPTLLRVQEIPLATVPSLVRPRPTTALDDTEFDLDIRDVFICHASEDKAAVARPLAESLLAGNLRVWFDEYELKIGDSLRRKIDQGLANSRFGVVILSESFFSKHWPQHELDGLVARQNSGEPIILPIWHKLSKAEVMAYSPSLADKIARSTSSYTVSEIAEEIISVVIEARSRYR